MRLLPLAVLVMMACNSPHAVPGVVVVDAVANTAHSGFVAVVGKIHADADWQHDPRRGTDFFRATAFADTSPPDIGRMLILLSAISHLVVVVVVIIIMMMMRIIII